MILVPIAAVLTLGSFLLAGCTGNLADVVRAIGESERSAYFRLNSIYVNSIVCGTGQVNVSVTCNAEGMTIRALGDSVDRQVGVPLTLVPQLSIGAPTLAAPHLGVVP